MDMNLIGILLLVYLPGVAVTGYIISERRQSHHVYGVDYLEVKSPYLCFLWPLVLPLAICYGFFRLLDDYLFVHPNQTRFLIGCTECRRRDYSWGMSDPRPCPVCREARVKLRCDVCDESLTENNSSLAQWHSRCHRCEEERLAKVDESERRIEEEFRQSMIQTPSAHTPAPSTRAEALQSAAENLDISPRNIEDIGAQLIELQRYGIISRQTLERQMFQRQSTEPTVEPDAESRFFALPEGARLHFICTPEDENEFYNMYMRHYPADDEQDVSRSCSICQTSTNQNEAGAAKSEPAASGDAEVSKAPPLSTEPAVERRAPRKRWK